MPDAVMPVWAHVAILIASLAVCAFVAERGWRREDRLRKKLGACRSSLHAAEILRDRYRRERDSLSIEVGKYRKSLPLSDRLTQVMPVKDEPDPAA